MIVAHSLIKSIYIPVTLGWGIRKDSDLQKVFCGEARTPSERGRYRQPAPTAHTGCLRGLPPKFVRDVLVSVHLRPGADGVVQSQACTAQPLSPEGREAQGHELSVGAAPATSQLTSSSAPAPMLGLETPSSSSDLWQSSQDINEVAVLSEGQPGSVSSTPAKRWLMDTDCMH